MNKHAALRGFFETGLLCNRPENSGYRNKSLAYVRVWLTHPTQALLYTVAEKRSSFRQLQRHFVAPKLLYCATATLAPLLLTTQSTGHAELTQLSFRKDIE